MDLTFQVPMQSCSLQHQTLLLSPVPSTTGYCFCFGSIPSFFLDQLTLSFASSISRNCSSQGEPRTSGAAKSILGTSPHLAFRSPHSIAFLIAHQLLLSLLHGFFLISLPSLMLNAIRLRFWQLPLSSPSLIGGLIFILMTLSRNSVFDSPWCISNSAVSPEL